LGEIQGFYAELRRESFWGNFKLELFEGLSGCPRGCTEEGGHLCYSFVFLGDFLGYSPVMCEWGTYLGKICVGARGLT
jgi:hypothetical protein